jgi:hypothetical protein
MDGKTFLALLVAVVVGALLKGVFTGKKSFGLSHFEGLQRRYAGERDRLMTALPILKTVLEAVGVVDTVADEVVAMTSSLEDNIAKNANKAARREAWIAKLQGWINCFRQTIAGLTGASARAKARQAEMAAALEVWRS